MTGADPDRYAEIVERVVGTTRSVPRHTEGGASAPPDAICPRHHVAYDSAYHCMICEQERPRQTARVTTHDDNHAIYISSHDTPLTPEQAIRLAASLLTSALRALDRRETLTRESTQRTD